MRDYEVLHVEDFQPLTRKDGTQVFAFDAVPYIVVDEAAIERRENAWMQERIARERNYEARHN